MIKELLDYCKEGNLEKIKELVDKGADKQEALDCSAENGYLEVVKYLVSLGADIHEENEYALYLSAQYGHLEVVKYLVSLGADIHADNEYALRWSAGNGHLEVVKYLIEQGANVDIAIQNAEYVSTISILKRYIPIELYKGPITDQTETECGICLTELKNEEDLMQCKVCKKCTHLSCSDKWHGPCIYCRN